ncbi:hypothetical protein [Streptomyces griseocarneus]|uniref:hypothetical protein n=1 Tax=Streptomyces griseocarneus TaxID=51201 RepID=UPI00167CCD67|nr:hypothetical protein [Streptomyces griseocarneus]MBZ6474640.1 hypothetical protein [Streptomyces griseocarneus]GHG67087.1 hypothetical protein GCM10018779_38840 [Streptomyces griseocarneus]
MPEDASQALVIADAENNYYVLPREVVEMARAAPEARAVIEEHLGAQGRVPLADGYTFVGVLRLRAEGEMTHYTTEASWPVATAP